MMFRYRIVIIDYILSVFVVVLFPELVSFLPGVFRRPTSDLVADEAPFAIRYAFVIGSSGCYSGRFLIVVSTKRSLFIWRVRVFLGVIPAIRKHSIYDLFLSSFIGSN
jgi:hypothetical protein